MGKEDETQFFVRNLDTGEARHLLAGALEPSFIGCPLGTRLLQVDSAASRWRAWWVEKRHRDEELWRAAESGCVTAVRAALAAGAADGGPPAEVNSRSLHGRAALHIAASRGRAACVELLLEARACVEQRTAAGLTALHLACQRGQLEAARSLLEGRADVCCEAEDGSLPLHTAAAGGHAEVMSLLLGSGRVEQQLSARNGFKQRPAEVAIDIDVAVLLREAAASEMSAGGGGGVGGPSPGRAETSSDDYAGRTPFVKGAVLLRNARSDFVTRLLHRTSQRVSPGGVDHQCLASKTPAPPSCSQFCGKSPPVQSFSEPSHGALGATKPLLEAGRPPSASGTTRHRRSQPFVRLLSEDRISGIEDVGPESFELVGLLGRGSFGEVFQVRHRGTQLECAMKILQKDKLKRGNLLRYAKAERNVLCFIRHPYIVALHCAFQTRSHLVLVMQYCPGGDLQQMISREGRLQEAVARLYAGEILLALGHLHERDIVFRDLKPANVVVDWEGHCMLTDFGLTKAGVAALCGARSFCGSLAFLAPEILLRRGHGQAVDLYGLGVLLFTMLAGLPPFFHSDRETLCANIRHARLQVPEMVSSAAASLIYALMKREPSQRLGAGCTSEVQRHFFFDGLDFDALGRREVPVPLSEFLDALGRHPGAESLTQLPGAGPGTGRGFAGDQAWRACVASPRGQEAAAASIDNALEGTVPGWEFTDVNFGLCVGDKVSAQPHR